MAVYAVWNKVTGQSWGGEAASPEAALKKVGWAKKDCEVEKVTGKKEPETEPED